MKTLEDNLCGLVDEFRNLSAVAETRTIYVSCGGQDKTESKYLNKDSFAVECERCKIGFGKMYNPPHTTPQFRAKVAPLFRGIVAPYSGQSSPPVGTGFLTGFRGL
jgi:hypothetical protein